MSNLESSVKGWSRFGFCPIKVRVENWGCQGCSRPVVVAKNCGPRDQDLFYGEFDDYRQAERSARTIRGHVTRYINKYFGEE